MIKRLSIKNIVFSFVIILITIIVVMQFFLYALLKNKANKNTNAILDSVAQNTLYQIEALNADIHELTFQLAAESLVQNSLYKFSHSEMATSIQQLKNMVSNYRIKIQKNNSMLAIFKYNKLLAINESSNLYHSFYEELNTILPETVTKSTFLPTFIYDGHTYFSYVTPIVPSDILYRSQEHTGHYILFVYEMSSISFAGYEFIDNDSVQLTITDKDDNILLSPTIENHGMNFVVPERQSNNLCRKYHLTNPKDWKIHISLVTSSSLENLDISVPFVAFMILLDIVILFLLLIFLKNIIIKRITLVKNSVERIPLQDTSYQITYDFYDEFADVVQVINQILSKVHDLSQDKIKHIESAYTAKLLQKETQIYYLHNQISPHFLYNSMSYIQALAVQYDAEEIIYLAASFSRLFRYFSNNMTFSTVQQDLSCAIEYFNIINNRRVTPLTLTYDVDDSINDVSCLKMIYQPVIENILKHAFSANETGTVSIRSIPHDTKIIIEIKDDGHGIAPEGLQHIQTQMENSSFPEINSSSHIGLLNVHARLKLHYGPESGLKILSTEGEGTTVYIMFERSQAQDKNSLQVTP